MPEEKPPLRLLYEPDEYLCTWNVPDNEEGVLALPGSLTLRAGRWPRGDIYGSVPIKWEETIDGGAYSAGFPQVIERPVLHGGLANGGSVLLLGAILRYWSDSRGEIIGRAALIGRGSSFGWRAPDADGRTFLNEVPTVMSIDCQIGALDAAMGVGPIASVRNPGIHPDNPRDEWAATVNTEADLTWEVDGIRLQVGYHGRMRAADAYEYRLAWSPEATFTLPHEVSFDEAMRDYVRPLRSVLSIATGRSQPLTYLAMTIGDEPTARQVFERECAQDPFQATWERVREAKCVIHAKPDDLSLLDLVLRWASLQRKHHPLIETYGAMLHAEDQHPRSRYLLLLQALEGMHGFETFEEYLERLGKHQARRELALAEAKKALDPKVFKFIRESILRTPITSLETALKAMLESLPVDMLSRLDATELVAELKKDPKKPTSVLSALRVARNNLAHGTRGYEPAMLDEMVTILELVVRAHALRLLGCPDAVIRRVLEDSRS